MNTRLSLAWRVLVASCLAAPAAIPSAVMAQSAPVTINTLKQPLVYYGPYYAAAAEGFDRKHGLSFNLVSISDGAQIAPALVNGTLDIGPCAFDALANLAEKGKDLIAVYQLVNKVTLDLVVNNSLLTNGVTATSPLAERFKALRGHTFGFTDPGAPSDVFMKILLSDGHLDPAKDVDMVRVGSISGLYAALKSKQIDGYMLSPPSPQQAQKAGVGTVLIRPSAGELPSLPSFYFLNICTSTDYLTKHPDIVAGYVQATIEGNAWLHANKDEYIKVISGLFPNVAPELWREAYELLLPSISTDGRFEQATVATAYRTYKSAGIISVMPDASEGVTWTNKFLK